MAQTDVLNETQVCSFWKGAGLSKSSALHRLSVPCNSTQSVPSG